MKIGLLDVDGHNFPNLALMKIASWHKQRGENVEWAMPMMERYDRIYASKIFTFTPDFNPLEFQAEEVMKGGTGYDIKSVLPPPLRKCGIPITASTRIATTPFSSIREGASVIARSALFTTRKVASDPLSRWN